MEIPEKLKLEYLLALDTHIETVGKENKEITLKKIFEITRDIADLGFGEKDIHEIAKDEDLYIRYEEWRKSNKTESIWFVKIVKHGINKVWEDTLVILVLTVGHLILA